MIALVGMMVACGGNDKKAEDNKANDNKDNAQKEVVEEAQQSTNLEISENDSDAVKLAKTTAQLINVMEQEPSAETFRTYTKLSMDLMSMMTSGNVTEEEVTKALTEIDPQYADDKAMDEKMQALQQKWTNWAEANQEEAQKIAMEVMGAM